MAHDPIIESERKQVIFVVPADPETGVGEYRDALYVPLDADEAAVLAEAQERYDNHVAVVTAPPDETPQEPNGPEA